MMHVFSNSYVLCLCGVDIYPQLTNVMDVVQEMLLEYISFQVAESILFVGKALQILWNPS